MNIHKLPTDLKSFNFIEDEVRILNWFQLDWTWFFTWFNEPTTDYDIFFGSFLSAKQKTIHWEKWMHDGINTSTSNNDAMHIETAKSYKNMIENGELTNIPWIL